MDKKKETKPKIREIFNWVNPTTKEVKLPGDLSAALKKNNKEAAYFETLSFTIKKEFINGLLQPSKLKQDNERITGTFERLGKQ